MIDKWLLLHSIHEIGATTLFKLIEYFESPEKILSANKKELLNINGIASDTIEAILNNKNRINVDKQINWLQKNSVTLITITDDEYPVNLKSIFCPPVILYVKGNLTDVDQISIAIVGSRLSTVYGATITRQLCMDLVASGITITSGMARGVDSIAHKTAIEYNGRTLAVLGSGIDIIYPPENRTLYHEISLKGAVISEFPLGTKPNKFNFPRRNRLISGLSLGTVVIEAGDKSGALITANYALEEGREVFAIPGNINSKQSIGTNRLIKRGEAKLIQNIDDILDEISPIAASVGKKLRQVKTEKKEPIVLSADEKKLTELINNTTPVHIDEIILNAGKNNISGIFSILLGLELKGVIKQLPGKNFILTN
ncbi:DNA-protecting protein DprA [Candidatus Poribacteria bacterium]|nr:DNA-protecting protein DprA [Candidatus Poribacteria bacterium]